MFMFSDHETYVSSATTRTRNENDSLAARCLGTSDELWNLLYRSMSFLMISKGVLNVRYVVRKASWYICSEIEAAIGIKSWPLHIMTFNASSVFFFFVYFGQATEIFFFYFLSGSTNSSVTLVTQKKEYF